MARITPKTNNRFKLTLSKEEMNTLTIAVALLSVPQMEDEAKEQGLASDEVAYGHLKLFAELSKATGLYQQKPKTQQGEEAK